MLPVRAVPLALSCTRLQPTSFAIPAALTVCFFCQHEQVDLYWKSGEDAWSRSDESLSKAPQMYNLSLALALVCKAGGCWEKEKTKRKGVIMEEDPSFCATTKVDAPIFMDNLVGVY